MSTYPTLYESRRLCGYRQPGGIYLVSTGPARGWTWVNATDLFSGLEPSCTSSVRRPSLADQEAAHAAGFDVPRPLHDCLTCPVAEPRRLTLGMAGLLWIGEKFYATPRDFLRETELMGVSRRVPAVPKHFVVGRTWVFMAHRKAIEKPTEGGEGELFGDTVWLPGVVQAFKPERIEYVLKGDETDDDIEALRKRGLTPVRVIERKGGNR